MKQVQDYIRTIVDFPHEGIMFRDVTTLFADPRGFRMAIDQMLHPYAGIDIDKVVGLDARGLRRTQQLHPTPHGLHGGLGIARQIGR